MTQSAPLCQALIAFQNLCHEYYTCFIFASQGMEEFPKRFPLDPATYPDQRIFIGHGHPDEAPAQSVMSAAKAAASTMRDGNFQDILGKALLIRIYAEWDERYRHDIAEEFSAKASDIRCDLMGDLRRVRHWIVHGKSMVGSGVSRILVLPWKLAAGSALHVTSAMFREFADCANAMKVQIGS